MYKEILGFPWDFLADFDNFSVGFSVVFQWIFMGLEGERGSDFMHQIARKQKNEGAALDLPCSGEATRGKAPLTPIVPLRQMLFEEENIVFGQNLYFYNFSRRG